MNFFVNAAFTLMICIMLFMILFNYLNKIKNWNKNKNLPRLTVPARVVAKRHEVRGRYNSNDLNSYFVTFEFESGDRLELLVTGTEFGMLVEGDNGKLSFQGTKYIDFKRM